MVFAGTTCAHTASDAEGVSPWQNCTVSRTICEVVRDFWLPNPPHDLLVDVLMKLLDSAPEERMVPKALLLINVAGDPESRLAELVASLVKVSVMALLIISPTLEPRSLC